ncbi:unnamed protein product [Calypogeia fissa]
MPDLLLRFDRPRSGESAQSSSARSRTELNSRKALRYPHRNSQSTGLLVSMFKKRDRPARPGQSRRGITFSNCQMADWRSRRLTATVGVTCTVAELEFTSIAPLSADGGIARYSSRSLRGGGPTLIDETNIHHSTEVQVVSLWE